jgi:hypothetical protein
VADLTPDVIAQNATKPASASVDGQSAEQVPIGDQIKAAQFAAANQPPASGRRRPRGIRLVRGVPPGAA